MRRQQARTTLSGVAELVPPLAPRGGAASPAARRPCLQRRVLACQAFHQLQRLVQAASSSTGGKQNVMHLVGGGHALQSGGGGAGCTRRPRRGRGLVAHARSLRPCVHRTPPVPLPAHAHLVARLAVELQRSVHLPLPLARHQQAAIGDSRRAHAVATHLRQQVECQLQHAGRRLGGRGRDEMLPPPRGARPSTANRGQRGEGGRARDTRSAHLHRSRAAVAHARIDERGVDLQVWQYAQLAEAVEHTLGRGDVARLGKAVEHRAARLLGRLQLWGRAWAKGGG